MRVGLITPYFWPCVGGVESHVFYLSKELVKRGYEVHVLTSDSLRKNGMCKKQIEVIDGINIHRFRTWIDISYYRRLWVTPSFIKSIAYMDLIHIHCYGHPHADITSILCKILKKPCVLTSHGPHLVNREFRPWHYRFLAGLHDATFGKITLNSVDAVIAVSPAEIPYLLNLGLKKEKLNVIPNGIPNHCLEKPNKNNFRKKYGLEDKFIVLFVGRLHQHKGAHILSQAIPNIVKEENNVHFIFMGPNEGQKKELEGLAKKLKIEDYVTFTGYVSEEEKKQALYACDLFVMPSLWEAFGIVLVEAMAAARPVIVSNVGNLPYLVKDRYNGFIIKYGDHAGLANSILKIINNPELAKEMGKRNAKIAQEYVWNRIADKIEELYLITNNNK